MPQPVRRQPTSRPLLRTLILCLVAGWLIVLAAPVAAQPPAQTPDGVAASATGTTLETTAAADRERVEIAGTDPAGDTDGAAEADRELVLGLVAIVLLAIAIGLHALYRDRD